MTINEIIERLEDPLSYSDYNQAAVEAIEIIELYEFNNKTTKKEREENIKVDIEGNKVLLYQNGIEVVIAYSAKFVFIYQNGKFVGIVNMDSNPSVLFSVESWNYDRDCLGKLAVRINI